MFEDYPVLLTCSSPIFPIIISFSFFIKKLNKKYRLFGQIKVYHLIETTFQTIAHQHSSVPICPPRQNMMISWLISLQIYQRGCEKDTLHKNIGMQLQTLTFCENIIRVPLCWDSYYIWSNCDGLILCITCISPKISVQGHLLHHSYTVTLLQIWFYPFPSNPTTTTQMNKNSHWR